MSFQGRLANGATVFGGATFERLLTVSCGSSDDPNAIGVDRYAEFTIAMGTQAGSDGKLWCDQHNLSIPFTKEFKIAGTTQPLWQDITIGAALQSLPGNQYVYTYALQNADFPGGSNTGTAQNLLLTAPGSLRYPQFFQLDTNIKKNFKWGTKNLSGQVDFFNMTNSASVLAKNTAVSLTSSRAVNADLDNVTNFLPARTIRVAFQMRW
jgi:hypothetical protein